LQGAGQLEQPIPADRANRYLALIRAILRRACGEWEWIDRVPRFKLFREAEGRVRSLTPQEFDALRRELPTHLADMAVFSVVTGLRQGNVKGLEWKYMWTLNGSTLGFPAASTRTARRMRYP